MKKIYFANTGFEFEFISRRMADPFEGIKKNPICLQLQFLPLLFANQEDEVLVLGQPDNGYLNELKRSHIEAPKWVGEEDISGGELITWGWSRTLKHWADTKQLIYKMPDWEVIQKVNSKQWSFNHSLRLPGARLIDTMEDLKQWLFQHQGLPVVLKTCFGLSARGNLLRYSTGEVDHKMQLFCQKEWMDGRPVIAEPWVERILDFSTLWYLGSEQTDFLGATKMVNNSQGVYRGSLIGDYHLLFREFPGLINEQKRYSFVILEKLKKEGYFGFVGIDSMIYRHNGKEILHPVVEINARMTMALAGLLMQKKHFPNKNICFFYDHNGIGVLPKRLVLENKEIKFNKQLKINELFL
ncbi:MAG: hypothetical protein ACSNEK_01145 [Parachlamydiaceae bacterium]